MMVKVKLLRDHRGWETDEEWHPNGAVIDVGMDKAAALIRCRWAEIVQEAEPIDYAAYTYWELKAMAKERGLNSKGKQTDLIKRLEAIDIVTE